MLSDWINVQFLLSGATSEKSYIFIDDVDPNPYRKGHRKDNVHNELEWQAIQDFILDVFHHNEDDFTLTILYGSTGMAVLKKMTPSGTPLSPARRIRRRNNSPFCAARLKLSPVTQALKSILRGKR